MGLLTRADDTGIAVRAALAGLSSGINDRLELIDAQLRALGQPGIPAPVRVLDTEVLAYLMANPTAGDPLPPARARCYGAAAKAARASIGSA